MTHQINGIPLPNEEGFFGQYGGQFIPPHLKEAMDEINVAYEQIRHTPEFQNELADLFANYVVVQVHCFMRNVCPINWVVRKFT